MTKGSKRCDEVIHEIALAGKKSLLDEYDILFDNQVTINIFRNEEHQKTNNPTSVGGVLEVDLVGDLPGFGEVYFNLECIANILCHHDLAKNKMIIFNQKENMFCITQGLLS